MKNLENIPKNNIYEVPEGYFEKLPGIIQSRIAAENPEAKKSPFFIYSVRFALPALLIGIAAFLFWPNGNQKNTAEELLAGVETSQLVDYLEESTLTEELIDNNELTEADIEEIEGLIYFGTNDQDAEGTDEQDIL